MSDAMKHRMVVADMSPNDGPDSWEVRCECGWKTPHTMPEAAADWAAEQHREIEALREALAHVRRCVECGETDMAYCAEGSKFLPLVEGSK